MAKGRFEITKQEVQGLERAYREWQDGPTRTRYQAVRLYSQGYGVAEICQITGCNRTSLMEWWRKYREGGLERLQDHRGGPVRSKLSQEQVVEVEEKLRMYHPHDGLAAQTQTASGQHWTIEDLARSVEIWYAVSWKSRTSYHDLFLACGFSYQRTEKVYKSRREAGVAEFQAIADKT